MFYAVKNLPQDSVLTPAVWWTEPSELTVDDLIDVAPTGVKQLTEGGQERICHHNLAQLTELSAVDKFRFRGPHMLENRLNSFDGHAQFLSEMFFFSALRHKSDASRVL